MFTAVVLVGKITGVSLGAFLAGNDIRTSVQAGMSMAQIGEFSFIIAGVAATRKGTGELLGAIAVAVSALTTLATPWLVRAAEPVAKVIDRKLPHRLQTFATLYGTWVERLRKPARVERPLGRGYMQGMNLAGLHHVTMITGDARQNVRFYAELLGLRLVKKTVNFDAPEAYHLYFGDEEGAAGSILTWFEFAGAARGRASGGMIHMLQLGVASEESLEFWEHRLAAAGYDSHRGERSLRFEDYDGLRLELVVADPGNPPLRARHPEIPAEPAIVGVEGARAYSEYAHVEERMLTDVLGFTNEADGEYRLEGSERRFRWAYDPPPDARAAAGAGTVHHIAWATPVNEQATWQERIRGAGGYVTGIIDRDYFLSIYFREPRGVLFEIATIGPGFAVDEDPEHLGEELRLPKQHEHLRSHLEQSLRPVENPRRVTA